MNRPRPTSFWIGIAMVTVVLLGALLAGLIAQHPPTAQPFAVDWVAVMFIATALVPFGTPPRPEMSSLVTVPARRRPVPENEPSTVVPEPCALT